MDSTSSEAAGTLSRRGHAYATGPRKPLENVINNLWDPQDNPDGFVSLGVAENVKSHLKKARIIIADIQDTGTNARRAGKLCQRLGPYGLKSTSNGIYR